MRKTVVFMMLLVMLSKVFGFGREMAIGFAFGASLSTDIYRAATAIPNVLVGGMMSAINNALIPYLNKASVEGKEYEFFRKVMSLVLLLSLFLLALVIVFAKPLSYLIVVNFPDEARYQTIYFMRLMSINMFFQIIVYTLTGYLQKNGRFYIAASSAIPMNISIISILVLFKGAGIMSLVIATILGYFLQMLWVFYPFLKVKFPFSLNFDLRDKYIKGFILMLIPVVLSQVSTQINGLVDQSLASGLEAGSISILSYAIKLESVFFSVLVVSYSSVLFSLQAKAAMSDDKTELFKITRDKFSGLMMLLIPVMVAMIYLALPITKVVYYRGEFNLEDVIKTSKVLMLYAPQIVSASISVILGNVFFSLQKSKIPMIATYVGVSVNIILDFILVQRFGIYGLAGATALASIMNALVILYFLKKLFVRHKVNIFSNSTYKYIVASLVMLGVLIIGNTVIKTNSDFIYLVIQTIFGASAYFLTLFLLRTSELVEARDTLIEKIKDFRR